MENEVGIIDENHGILGFTRQLASALQRQIIISRCESPNLSLILEFDPICSHDNRLTRLTGTLEVNF